MHSPTIYAIALTLCAAPWTVGAQARETATPARGAILRTSPGGRSVARVDSGARLEVLAKYRGWWRVRTEGWVIASDLVPADSALLATLTAADLRADPDGMRGRIVRWEIEVIALQRADPLRRGLVADEPYLLARGPGDENSLLYIAVPPSLLGTARALSPLTRATIVARVRHGRSEPVGVPVLDLQAITRK